MPRVTSLDGRVYELDDETIGEIRKIMNSVEIPELIIRKSVELSR